MQSRIAKVQECVQELARRFDGFGPGVVDEVQGRGDGVAVPGEQALGPFRLRHESP